jgi:PAS domain S-box-containing protein
LPGSGLKGPDRSFEVSGMQQRNLVLILARDLADKLASAVFVVDDEGTLVYFNEAAAEILGKTFGEVGMMREEEWSQAIVAMEFDGRPIATDQLPLAVARRERRPTHRALKIKNMEGDELPIAVTALPLFARKDEFVGAAAVFWEHHVEDARREEAQP